MIMMAARHVLMTSKNVLRLCKRVRLLTLTSASELRTVVMLTLSLLVFLIDQLVTFLRRWLMVSCN